MSGTVDMNKGTGFYVVEFLKSLPDSESNTLLSESIVKLNQYFCLGESNPEQFKLKDGITLRSLYEAQWKIDHPTPIAPVTPVAPAAPASEDPGFTEFLAKLRSKGFFANVTEGSPAYEKRMEIARRQYNATKHQRPTEVKKEASETKKDDVTEDPGFKHFLEILEKKGFFMGVTKGTPEYAKRMDIAKSNYLLKAKKANPNAMEVEPQESEEERKAKAEEWKAKGNAEFSQKNYSKAVEYYTEAIKKYPNNCIYFSNRAACHLTTGDNNAAIADCEEAIRLDPRFVKSYIRLGTALMAKKMYKEAIDRGFDKALEIDPTNSSALQGKAQAQEALLSAPSAAPPPPAAAATSSSSSSQTSAEPPRASRQQPAGAGAAGGAGLGGLGGLAGLLNDPTIQQAAQNVMSGMANGGGFDLSSVMGLMQNPMFSQLASNPAVQQAAMSMMQNPDMLGNLFSGLGAGGAAPSSQNQQGEDGNTAATDDDDDEMSGNNGSNN